MTVLSQALGLRHVHSVAASSQAARTAARVSIVLVLGVVAVSMSRWQAEESQPGWGSSAAAGRH